MSSDLPKCIIYHQIKINVIVLVDSDLRVIFSNSIIQPVGVNHASFTTLKNNLIINHVSLLDEMNNLSDKCDGMFWHTVWSSHSLIGTRLWTPVRTLSSTAMFM